MLKFISSRFDIYWRKLLYLLLKQWQASVTVCKATNKRVALSFLTSFFSKSKDEKVKADRSGGSRGKEIFATAIDGEKEGRKFIRVSISLKDTGTKIRAVTSSPS